mmetsp:Transcript_3851/g.5223  ORF Transcript_3851/g.5223 Transcript_3851/m.5223 type:complete len:265 (-) Transcript_3851:359-1153(-)
MKSLNDDGFTVEHRPHVVQLFDFYDTPRQYFLVCEMMQGGELFDRIVEKTYYSVNDAKECGRTLLNAVKFLHDRKVCHRDLKPENLLLKNFKSDTLLKIADFGFARKATGVMNTQCGTPGYVAPEILENYDYGLGVDMWSVGVILYTLLAGYPPFLENDQKELYKKIKNGDFEFHATYWYDIDESPKNLIRRMLTVDPKHRITVDGALSHPFFGDDTSQDGQMLMQSLENLRRFNGRRKFRAAIHALIVTNRLERLTDLSNTRH